MGELFVPIIIGLIVIALGIMNMMGNINTLHSYHRKRVAEEDRLPFGRRVGAGTIIVGCALIVKAVMQFAAEKTDTPALDTIGTVILAAGGLVGFIIIILAMMKYNKGLW